MDYDFGLVAFQKLILQSCRHLMLNPSWDAIANNDSTSEKLRRKKKKKKKKKKKATAKERRVKESDFPILDTK